jgi:para-nitrobenzyl esterase
MPRASAFGRLFRPLLLVSVLLFPRAYCLAQSHAVQQRTRSGILEGLVSADGLVRSFKGIPYAAPPVGPLRWRPPQPLTPWAGVRQAADYGPRCMQTLVYDDMIFRDAGPSEDCLYLNVWIPEAHPQAPVPVMVWVYGGGFKAGATSEPRQDGANLSKRGVIVVSMNYRLGIFGFFSYPELAKESGVHASGNYGLMDQVAALEWVHDNIGAFGGDPDNVTIFGESAGSSSVSALMASPLARGLFRRAIGESGALFDSSRPMKTRQENEELGASFAKSTGAASLEELRAKPAREVLDAAASAGAPVFRPTVDGYFLPESVAAMFSAGKQSCVALLAGWNADEDGYREILKDEAPTREAFVRRVRELYGANADAILKLYPASDAEQVKHAARDLASDRSTGLSTWKWLEAQLKTGSSPVYRFHFEETLPFPAGAPADAEPAAPHASEIEFVFEVLPSRNLPWRPQDQAVSELMGSYWTNFAKTGDPNGAGLPRWPAYGPTEYPVMHLNRNSQARPDGHRDRYQLLSNLRRSANPSALRTPLE